MIMRIIVTAIVAFGLSYILSGIYIDSFWTAILLAIVLALLNALVKPLLVLFTLPITLLTLGLFLFIVNAIIVVIADALLTGFETRSFWWALLFGVLLSFISSLLYVDKRKKES